MNVEEFLRPLDEEKVAPPMVNEPIESSADQLEVDKEIELDVQKEVVEQLAADKAQIELVAEQTKNENERLQLENAKLSEELAAVKAEIEAYKGQLAAAKNEAAALREKEFDLQERNPNALALLDRDVELPDRFPGETRDQLLEVIREARDAAEKEGRLRRAQVLEGVLIANEPNGTLAERREKLKKIFEENANIISGTVINELKALGLTHKEGEDYLLPSEILLRNY